jgi:SAM-dependent methyltransferase
MVKAIWASLSGALQARIGHIYDNFIIKKISPPDDSSFIGDGDFEQIGQEFLSFFIKFGNLQRTDKVLDVGCGIGRMALPLTQYLNRKGQYVGFDIMPTGVDWCRAHISSKFPNFIFRLADVYNEYYNPTGLYQASVYKFPYQNEYFDFIFLTSVFTHMLPLDLENYLSEIARVLKKGKRCFITYFLLNTESVYNMECKLSQLSFSKEYPNYHTLDNACSEEAIAYNENYIIDLYAKYKLDILKPLQYGFWCGRKDHLTYQDVIIAERSRG